MEENDTKYEEEERNTDQYAASTITGYGAEVLTGEGKWTEENPCLAKPQRVKSCSLNALETEETLMMLQTHFIDLEKHKRILVRSNLGCLQSNI